MDSRIESGLENLTLSTNQNTESIQRDGYDNAENHTACEEPEALFGSDLTANDQRDQRDESAQCDADDLDCCSDSGRCASDKKSVLVATHHGCCDSGRNP